MSQKHQPMLHNLQNIFLLLLITKALAFSLDSTILEQDYYGFNQIPSQLIQAQLASRRVRNQEAVISCSNLTNSHLNSRAITQICSECGGVEEVYDLIKTDWTEIDLPVLIEASLMKIFSEIRVKFPGVQFYMGFKEADMCFATDSIDSKYNLEKVNNQVKPLFQIDQSSIFDKTDTQMLQYLLLRYQKNIFAHDSMLTINYKTEYPSLQVVPLMKDQVQLILQSVEVDTFNDRFNYKGSLSFIQSGIDMPFIIRNSQDRDLNLAQEIIVQMDKQHTLNEFIYTFQKMGISITSPVLKGLKDYQGASVNHITLQVSPVSQQIQSFSVFFLLPDFAILPEIFLKQVSGNLVIMFDEQRDSTKTQAYVNINALFTFNNQNYYATIVRKAFEGTQVKVLDETKVFPEKSMIENVPLALNDFARILSLTPHQESLPEENNFSLLMQRFNLLSVESKISSPKIKLINQPLRVVRVSGHFSAFDQDDSEYIGVLTSVNGELAVTQAITFEGSQANNALWKLFNFQNLVRRDKLELNAFKLLAMKLTVNNMDLNQYSKIFAAQSNNFLGKGIQIELDMELKKFCQADIFCMMLTKFYGSMFVFKLKGSVHPITRKISLSTDLQDIKFNDNYILDDASLVIDITYIDLENPDIDIYAEGDLIAEIQPGVTLKFLSRIQLTDEGALRLRGEMNRVFVNAFNLNNMLNTTQMSIMTTIDQDGMLSQLQITGIGVFGVDCYKVSAIPEIFGTELPYPKFGSKQQQKLLALLNQSYIDEDKCETANINLITYPNNTKENFFKGKLNLVNLKQFYQIFFNKIADQLTAITPDNIREQELVSHQVDLIYDPGYVYINGVQLTGAFIFNGLMNFHGLNAHVRLVMDPDYQKYLYFTIVLPSFSLSQQNVKFLSPIEYIEVLKDDTKAILNAFGAPKIEMQIPIEQLKQELTKFQIRGMLSIMGIHQLVTCDFDQQRLFINMKGNPYQGLFEMDFRISTIIQSGHISENIAGIVGVFRRQSSSNLQKIFEIENYLSRSVEEWMGMGLHYLQAWRDRIVNLEDTIRTVEQTQYCDPNQCPAYSQCSSNLIVECKQHLEEYECERMDDVCTDLQQKCTKVSKVCLRKDRKSGTCTSEVEVCEEWQNICLGYDQQICKKFRAKPESKVNKVCKVYDLSCQMRSRIDQDCFMKCTQIQQNYHRYSDLLKVYRAILNQTEHLMGNLTQLKDHLDQMKERDSNQTFVNVQNMTLEGLLDSYMLPQNTNISFEVSYMSPFDDKERLLRSAIDFHSTSATAKLLRPFILEDLCNIYGIPSKLATRMSQIIQDIEGSVRTLLVSMEQSDKEELIRLHENSLKNSSQDGTMNADSNITQIMISSKSDREHEIIQRKFQEIVGSSGRYDMAAAGTNQTQIGQALTEGDQVSRAQTRVSLVEKRLNQMMLEKELKGSQNIFAEGKGLESEHHKRIQNQNLLNENQIYALSEFLSERA